MFWQNGDDRTGLKDRLAFYDITYDGSTTNYVIDIQLKPKLVPTCSWYLADTGTINREKTAYSYADDDYSWVYEGTTHFHYNKYGSEVIFDSIGNLTVTFDFDDGDGYESTNKHTYTTIGDYTPKHKAVNSYSLESICDDSIRIKYNSPIGCLSFTPDGIGSTDEVSKGDTVDITACITDEDSRITDIEHHWIIKDRDDNSTIIRDTTVDNNTTLDYNYNKEILELQDTFGYQYISWNDGWEDKSITKYKELTITNLLPEVTVSKTDLSAKEKRFIQTSNDLDGDVVTWVWKIYLLMPFSGDWVEVWTKTNDGTAIDLEFSEAGTYKTEIEVTDDVGGKKTAEIQYEISAAGNCTGVISDDEIYFIFPDII